MFGKTIVCVDEPSGGRDAIALAKQLVAPDGKLMLAHVVSTSTWEPLASRAAYAAGERRKPAEQDRAEGLLRTARDQAGLASHRSISLRVVWSPWVGRGLHEFADIEDADLLVLGSSRRGMLGRVLLGDHTRAALNGAPCAVAVAPRGLLRLLRRRPSSRHRLRRIARKRACTRGGRSPRHTTRNSRPALRCRFRCPRSDQVRCRSAT